jgi:hypothetical protein
MSALDPEQRRAEGVTASATNRAVGTGEETLIVLEGR